MSKVAIESLRLLWRDLVFAKITDVFGRDPEHVLFIHIYKYEPTSDGTLYRTGQYQEVKSKRLSEIPREDRKFAHVAWKHYYGFAASDSFPEGIYFSNSRYGEIDFDIHMSLDLCRCGNHSSGSFQKPRAGQWICGRVEESPKRGNRFTEWFCVDQQTKTLIELVQSGKCNLSELELAKVLIGGACGYPDTLWAIARLVFFDNVQAFFDQFGKTGQNVPDHPCKGFVYGHTYPEGYENKVEWNGMYLATQDTATFVHTLSQKLDPQWWSDFQRICVEQDVSSIHSDYCDACHEEREEENDDNHIYDY